MEIIILILLSAGIILIAISSIRLFRIYDLLPLIEVKASKQLRRLVKVQHALLPVFISGYIMAAFEIFNDHTPHLKSIIGLILFFGGVYVLISTYIKMFMARSAVMVIGSMIPICAKCKKIRTGEDSAGHEAVWQAMEIYMGATRGLKFSHGLCPECLAEYEADLDKE